MLRQQQHLQLCAAKENTTFDTSVRETIPSRRKVRGVIQCRAQSEPSAFQRTTKTVIKVGAVGLALISSLCTPTPAWAARSQEPALTVVANNDSKTVKATTATSTSSVSAPVQPALRQWFDQAGSSLQSLRQEAGSSIQVLGQEATLYAGKLGTALSTAQGSSSAQQQQQQHSSVTATASSKSTAKASKKGAPVPAEAAPAATANDISRLTLAELLTPGVTQLQQAASPGVTRLQQLLAQAQGGASEQLEQLVSSGAVLQQAVAPEALAGKTKRSKRSKAPAPPPVVVIEGGATLLDLVDLMQAGASLRMLAQHAALPQPEAPTPAAQPVAATTKSAKAAVAATPAAPKAGATFQQLYDQMQAGATFEQLWWQAAPPAPAVATASATAPATASAAAPATASVPAAKAGSVTAVLNNMTLLQLYQRAQAGDTFDQLCRFAAPPPTPAPTEAAQPGATAGKRAATAGKRAATAAASARGVFGTTESWESIKFQRLYEEVYRQVQAGATFGQLCAGEDVVALKAAQQAAATATGSRRGSNKAATAPAPSPMGVATGATFQELCDQVEEGATFSTLSRDLAAQTAGAVISAYVFLVFFLNASRAAAVAAAIEKAVAAKAAAAAVTPSEAWARACVRIVQLQPATASGSPATAAATAAEELLSGSPATASATADATASSRGTGHSLPSGAPSLGPMLEGPATAATAATADKAWGWGGAANGHSNGSRGGRGGSSRRGFFSTDGNGGLTYGGDVSNAPEGARLVGEQEAELALASAAAAGGSAYPSGSTGSSTGSSTSALGAWQRGAGSVRGPAWQWQPRSAKALSTAATTKAPPPTATATKDASQPEPRMDAGKAPGLLALTIVSLMGDAITISRK